jgi:hypothetical protein
LIADLESSLAVEVEKQQGDPGDRLQVLEQQLEAAESDRDELACRLVEAEHQAGKLMNLYVATYQLHATLDPAEVQSSIAEVVVDLLGAECFALLLKDETGSGCEIALAKGTDEQSGLFSGDRYVSDLSEDRDLLDLLAAHAASALFAARVYAATDRKLRTLQSLVELMRGH